MKKLTAMFVAVCAIAATLVLSGCSHSYDEHVASDDICKILIVSKDFDPNKDPSYVVETTNRTENQMYFRIKDNRVEVAGQVREMKLRENTVEPTKTSTQYISFPAAEFPTPDEVTDLYFVFEACDMDGNVLGSYPFYDPKLEDRQNAEQNEESSEEGENTEENK